MSPGPYRARIPTEPGYAELLGQAIYNFAYMEWNIIWIIERLCPGYLATQPQLHPSGKIAGAFDRAIEQAKGLSADLERQLEGIAARFRKCKDRRNQLLHAHPHTSTSGKQLLLRSKASSKISWDSPLIIDAARDFEALAIDAAKLFHSALKSVGKSRKTL